MWDGMQHAKEKPHNSGKLWGMAWELSLRTSNKRTLSMERGYVKLWRNIEDTGLLQNPTAWQVYTWLMILAAVEETTVMISPSTTITLKSGEMVFSRAMLVRELCISEQQAKTAMKALEMLGLVIFKTTNRYTLASIVNWEEQQNAE